MAGKQLGHFYSIFILKQCIFHLLDIHFVSFKAVRLHSKPLYSDQSETVTISTIDSTESIVYIEDCQRSKFFDSFFFLNNYDWSDQNLGRALNLSVDVKQWALLIRRLRRHRQVRQRQRPMVAAFPHVDPTQKFPTAISSISAPIQNRLALAHPEDRYTTSATTPTSISVKGNYPGEPFSSFKSEMIFFLSSAWPEFIFLSSNMIEKKKKKIFQVKLQIAKMGLKSQQFWPTFFGRRQKLKWNAQESSKMLQKVELDPLKNPFENPGLVWLLLNVSLFMFELQEKWFQQPLVFLICCWTSLNRSGGLRFRHQFKWYCWVEN